MTDIGQPSAEAALLKLQLRSEAPPTPLAPPSTSRLCAPEYEARPLQLCIHPRAPCLEAGQCPLAL